MDRIFITAEQAMDLLPDGEYIHTFYDLPEVVAYADWERSDLMYKIVSSDVLELTGEDATSLGYGLCAHSNNSRQSEILFIKTNPEKLKELEYDLKEEN